MPISSPVIIPDRFLPEGDADFADAFSDQMILQADKPITIWGFGKPGTRLEVQLGGEFRATKITRDFHWKVTFPPRNASFTPETLFLYERNSEGAVRLLHSISDILIGELWFCSGQSNMELGLGAADGGKVAAAESADPALRYLLINKSSSPIPLSSLGARWKTVNPQGVLEDGWGGLSAIGYWFARELRAKLGVPVGVIQAAYGGAKIHAFLQRAYIPSHVMQDERREWKSAEAQAENNLMAIATSPKAPVAESVARNLHPFKAFDQWDTLKTGSVWNAMIHPVLPLGIRGFLWYQGESDVGLHETYPEKMHTLLKGIRKDFGRVPFLFAQIAPWNYGDDQGNLAKMWRAQIDFSHRANVPLISTLDVGNLADIHPTAKEPVARRFANQALASVYRHRGIDAGSPAFKKIRKAESVITVMLSKELSLKEGLTALGFSIIERGGERTILPGKVQGKEVTLTIPENIDAVRLEYGWEGDGNLASHSGEPALPFSVAL